MHHHSPPCWTNQVSSLLFSSLLPSRLAPRWSRSSQQLLSVPDSACAIRPYRPHLLPRPAKVRARQQLRVDKTCSPDACRDSRGAKKVVSTAQLSSRQLLPAAGIRRHGARRRQHPFTFRPHNNQGIRRDNSLDHRELFPRQRFLITINHMSNS